MMPHIEFADKNVFIMKCGIQLSELADAYLLSITLMESALNVTLLPRSTIMKVDVVTVLRVIIRFTVKDVTVFVPLSVMLMKIS